MIKILLSLLSFCLKLTQLMMAWFRIYGQYDFRGTYMYQCVSVWYFLCIDLEMDINYDFSKTVNFPRA